MQNKIRIKAMDELQYFFEACNNDCMYCAVYMDGSIDYDRFRQAVKLSLTSVPTLKCRLVTTGYHPYWKAAEFSTDEIVSFMESSDPKYDLSRAVTCNIDALHGPQLKIHILRYKGHDTLCTAVNHMICDGAGLKEYLYLLGDIYTNLENGQNFQKFRKNKNVRTGKVYKNLSLLQRLKMPKYVKSSRKSGSDFEFPFGGEPAAPFISTFKLSRERFKVIKAFGKAMGCTINDVVMAASIRALYRFLSLDSGTSLPMPCMMDLRKYMALPCQMTVCNLTSTVTCDIGSEIGSNLKETVLKVKHSMDENKDGSSNMYGLFYLNCLCSILPFGLLKKVMSAISVNPKISFTNIGIIDKEHLHFGNVPVRDAFMTGAVKYRPYFQLALSTYDGMVTFSIDLVGSEKDKEALGRFYSVLNQELPQ